MKKTLAGLAFFAAVTFGILACNKDENEKNVPLRLLLTDNPVDYDSVNIQIKGVRIKLHDDNAGWIDVQSLDTTVNLLDLQNGVTTVLAQDSVPQGRLKEVRFLLGPDNYVVVNGTRYNLETPSAESSGLKIKIDKDLSQSLNSFILDFDAAASVKEQNGQYKLMPVIKLKD
ncbi:MAG TPA: DUF4382 domain-containing protein [Flavisolibacter sp.]|nr:DUF4382 domain-containing protein [Flavisolibacter sp.]